MKQKLELLDKEKYFYTTNNKLRKYLEILGFTIADVVLTPKNRIMMAFIKTESLDNALNQYFTLIEQK